MKGWTRSLALVALAAASAAAADLTADVSRRAHGKLDLDIYAPSPVPLRSLDDAAGLPLHGWVPGDARAERGEPGWVKHLSHLGYAGLGAAGLAASVATGGIAPAVGFGIVTAVQSFLEWREIEKSSSEQAD